MDNKLKELNDALLNFDWKNQPETEQQKYIRTSREAIEYKDMLKCTQDFFKKTLGIEVSNIGFFTAPSKGKWNNGKMYQMSWDYPHSRYAFVFVDTKPEDVPNIIEFIEANMSIVFNPEYKLQDLEKGRLEYFSLKFDIYEFYKLIGWDMWKDKEEMLSEENYSIRRVIDQNSNLFGERVKVIGMTTYRSFKDNFHYVVTPLNEPGAHYWFTHEQTTED